MADLSDLITRVEAGEVEFARSDTAFHTLDAATQFMKVAGFSVGPGCAGLPTCCMFGDYSIAKWRNLTRAERNASHAVMDGDRRHGPLRIRLTGACPEGGREGFAAILRMKEVSNG